MTVVLFYRLILSDFGNSSSSYSFSSSSSSSSPSASSSAASSSSGTSNNSNSGTNNSYHSTKDKCNSNYNTPSSNTPNDGYFNRSPHSAKHDTSNFSGSKNQLPLDQEEQIQQEQYEQKSLLHDEKRRLQKEHLLNHSIEQVESEKSVVSKMKHQPQVNQYNKQKYNQKQEKWNTSKEQIVLASSKSNDSTYEAEGEEEQMLQHQNTSTTTTTSTSTTTPTTSTSTSTTSTTSTTTTTTTTTTRNDDSLHVTNAKEGSDILRNFNRVDFCTYNCVKEEKRTDSNNETASNNNQTLQLEQCPC